MTSVEQLQICGIRSFDPDPANKQSVYFQKPLTVILGKNGAGKTTIIEALLNACTGSMPPGSGTEKSSFVYDPKVMGESEVKAQIRLIFTGKGGKVMQVIRSFQASHNRNRLTFTTLDNTVAYQDTATGKVVSHTYRANDVDRVVPEMLGVSPAVLEHVIFCHQEECNWPLAPPKDLKRIFDEIFAATRYVMALDRLRENSKELRRQQKEHEASLMALREHRDQAQQLEEDIQLKEKLVQTVQTRNTSIEPELKALHGVAASLNAVEQNIESLSRQAAQIQGRMDEKQDAICRAALPPCQRTLEEMQELRSESTVQVTKAETDITHKVQQLTLAQQTTRQREEVLYRLRSQLENMERDDQAHKRHCVELRNILSNISPEFVLSEDSVDERNLSRIMDQVRHTTQINREGMQRALQQCSDEISIQEERRQSLLREMDADSKERGLVEDLYATANQRLQAAQASVRQLGGEDCRQCLEKIQQEVKILEGRVEAAEELRRHGEHYQNRQRIAKEFEKQNAHIARLRQDMVREKKRTGGHSEAAALRKQIETRCSDLATGLADSVIPYCQQLFIQVSAGDEFHSVGSKIEQARQLKQDLLTRTQGELGALDRKGAAMEQSRTYTSEQLTRQEAELQQKQTAVIEILGSFDAMDTYERTLQRAREKLDGLQQKRHALEAMAACYTDFIEAARTSNQCAVCDRSFPDHDAAQSFIEKHEAKQRTSPQAILDIEAEIVEAQVHLKSLEAVRKVVEDVRQLRTALPPLEIALRTMAAEEKQHTAVRADVIARCQTITGQLQGLNDLCLTMASLRAIDVEITGLRSQLTRVTKQNEEAMIQNDADNQETGKSYEELTEEYEAATVLLHQLNGQLSEAQRLEDGAPDHDASKSLLEKRSEMYQAETTVSKLTDLRGTIAQLEKEQQTHKRRLQALQTHRTELLDAVDSIEKCLHQLREKRKSVEQSQTAKMTTVEQNLRTLESSVTRVMDYIRSEGGRRLHALRDERQRVEEAYRRGMEEVTTLTNELTASRKTVEEFGGRMLEMQRTIEVLELQRALDADTARIRDIERSLEDLKGSKLQGVEDILGPQARTEPLLQLREILRSKIGELEKLKAQQEGNLEAVLQHVNDLKVQLARERYHNVERRYRSTFLKVQTTEIAVKDIERYYGALEKAVQSYHQEKIEQINRIISDLWRQTYRGSDIDTVEIRSETEATTSTASRRSYNYRVVMKRGNNEIDMRGRCSAGQKVLASVIIRLALSEALCVDCGILALDEPTTNLDEDNARSLAQALRLLIESRRNVKHFQLIVITHDEQFVRALGGQSLDRFYYVHKDREGAFSVVEERTFGQLFT